ncbi:hypothetical protein QFC24_004305 [Naganishia onofrii]|uniref:Uncharacterized protein n=1 Tax=Naganishia onofrii TaxID=1851511 RepID=A0ACC2XDG3_9TREE|nr:hypothetical protein QFC24_004305 [Naganishia onofrii]
MLKVAGDKLNVIVNTVEERLEMDVNQVEAHGEDVVFNRVKERRAASAATQQDRHAVNEPIPIHSQAQPGSSPIDRGASKLEEERRSVAKWEQQKNGEGISLGPEAVRQAGSSAVSAEFQINPSSPSSKTTITPIERPENSPLTDLEVRLDTAKAVDLFTMQLKASSTSSDYAGRQVNHTVIHFNPTSTKRQVVHKRAHIFVLSDLFLMCERMSATEKAEKAKEVWANNPNRVGDGGPLPEMFLLYPPLAGRHLSVLSGGVETELIVTVMKRETFLLKFDDRQSREDTLKALQDCIDFASSVSRSGTSRSAINSPQLDGSMINDNRQNGQRYLQQGASQDTALYHGPTGASFSHAAHNLATPPPQCSHSAEVYGDNGRNSSAAAGRPRIPSADNSRHMREMQSEPDSPVDDTQQAKAGPAVVAARLKCKVFLKHGHQQWKPLGPARLQLYIQQGTNIKQLVVEADTREKTMLISTIVLTDGVERVAKTGVAVEISDGQGKRAGLIYMLKCEDEESAGELFSRLISGSDRARSLSVSRK